MRARYYSPYLRRFLNEDPIGFGGGMNWWGYVSGSPIGTIDPNGLDAIVVVNGNKVSIDLPITFSGAGVTPARIKKIQAGIQKAWSGTFGEHEVTTTVTEVAAGKGNQVNLTTDLGRDGYRSQVDWKLGWDGGTWVDNGKFEGDVAAHEAGHLLGLPDRYTNYKVDGKPQTVAHAGYTQNIMGVVGAGYTPSSADIAYIISNNGKATASIAQKVFNDSLSAPAAIPVTSNSPNITTYNYSSSRK